MHNLCFKITLKQSVSQSHDDVIFRQIVLSVQKKELDVLRSIGSGWY